MFSCSCGYKDHRKQVRNEEVMFIRRSNKNVTKLEWNQPRGWCQAATTNRCIDHDVQQDSVIRNNRNLLYPATWYMGATKRWSK